MPDNASLFSGPHLPQDLPSCQTIAQKCSGRGKISGSSEAGTVTERTGAAVCLQKAGTLEFQQSTIRKLETLQNYLKTNEYDKIQDYLPAITDDFQRERFHPICQDSLINAILADKRFLAMQKNIKVTYEVLLPEKSNIPSSELSSIFFNLLDNGIESCNASGSEAPFISVTSKMSAGFLTVHMKNSKDPAQPFNHKTSKKDIPNHGFGLSIIEDICAKNDGSCQWIDNGDTFDSVVMLRYQ